MDKRKSVVAMALALTLLCGFMPKPVSAGGGGLSTAAPVPKSRLGAVEGSGSGSKESLFRSITATASATGNQDIGNSYVTAKIGRSGRFNFALDPAGNARFYDISYAWPYEPGTSFTTVRVDGSDLILAENGQTQPPTNDGGLSNSTIWRIGDVEVRQSVSVAANPRSGQPDTARIQYTLTNTGPVSHDVGLRIMIDTMIDGNDGAPYGIPGPSGDLEVVTTEREYEGAAIPHFWRAFRDLVNPDVSAQWVLQGGDATPPSRVATASWWGIWNTSWDYSVDTSREITSDSAVGMWWNPQTLAPGQTKAIVQYYGSSSESTQCPVPDELPEELPWPDEEGPVTPDSTSGAPRGSGVKANAARCVPIIVINGEEKEIDPRFPLIERDGKVFFPLNSLIAELGMRGDYGRESTRFGGGQVLVYLMKSNRVVIFARDRSDWALVNFRKVTPGTDVNGERIEYGGVDSFVNKDNGARYFDIEQVAKLMGGWVMSASESIDGRHHIRIPQNVGTWLGACEDAGYFMDDDSLGKCDVVYNQIIDSYWERFWQTRGPATALAEAHRLVLHYDLQVGENPFTDSSLAKDAPERYNPMGLTSESKGYDWFWAKMEDTATYAPTMLTGLFFLAMSNLNYAVENHRLAINYDPAPNWALSQETYRILERELMALGNSQAEIEAYLQAEGLVKYPISVTGPNTLASNYTPGFYLRIYGVNPEYHGPWYVQADLSGQPDPHFFSINGHEYVAVVEYTDGHRWMDGYGDPVSLNLPKGTRVRLEVKSGTESHVKSDGTFDSTFLRRPDGAQRWLENFRDDVARAKAGKEEVVWAFSNARTEAAFRQLVKDVFGEQFYKENANRILFRSTGPVVTPPGTPKVPSLPPPRRGPVITPDGGK